MTTLDESQCEMELNSNVSVQYKRQRHIETETYAETDKMGIVPSNVGNGISLCLGAE